MVDEPPAGDGEDDRMPAEMPEGPIRDEQTPLVEDKEPGTTSNLPLVENREASSSPVFVANPHDKARAFLSYLLVWTVALLAVGGGAVWALNPAVDMRNLLTILTPVTTLAASVVSFYFRTEK